MRSRRLKNEINVVPYIDVMLVLLVIFMVTAPMITTATIEVPSVGKAAQPPAEALQVIVNANQRLELREPGGGLQEVSSRELSQAILAAQKKNPDLAVVIEGHRDVKYAAVIKVMDELQRQEIKRIGLLVEQTGK